MVQEEKYTTEEGLEIVEDALTKTEQFIENNQKNISVFIIAIIVVVGGYFAYAKMIVAPRQQQAMVEIFGAEQAFKKDSFKVALNGNDKHKGFLNIIDEFGSTKTGNLASYYAGVSYLRLGEYDKAIEYLSDFSSSDVMIAPVAKGAMGDAYMELNKIDDAADQYIKASELADNEFLSPIYLMKAGRAFEDAKDYKNALSAYEKLDHDYSTTTLGRNAEKFIARVKQKM